MPDAERLVVRTIDISLTGLAVVAGMNPLAGTVLEIELALPVRPKSLVPIKSSARVVYAVFSASEGGFKIGLVFTQLSAQQAQAILIFVQ